MVLPACGADDGAGADRASTTAAPEPPGAPTDACALLDPSEVEALIGEADDGEGTESGPPPEDAPAGAAATSYADCAWPSASEPRLFLTWVQPSPSPNAEVWLERSVAQSLEGADQQVRPLEVDEPGLDAGMVVAEGRVLRVAGVLDDEDLLTLEVYDPPVEEGSSESDALVDALEAAASRL